MGDLVRTLGILVDMQLKTIFLRAGCALLFAFPVMFHSATAQMTQAYQYDQPAVPDVIQAYVDASYAWDDNLFRTPAALSGGAPTSDSSWKRDGGMQFDKTFSRQHVTASFDLNRTTFQRFSAIDFDGKDAQFNWNWGMTNDFAGNIGSSYSQTLTPYNQFHLAELNLRNQKSDFSDGTWLLTPRWQLRASVNKASLNYDLNSQQYLDRSSHIGNVALYYVAPSGNSLGLTVQHEREEFPNALILGGETFNNNYTQNELRANLDYSVGGLTRIQLVCGWLRREHDYFHERDISGPSVRLFTNWLATGKSSVNLTAWRNVSGSDDLAISYAISKGITLNPVWNPIPKMQVETSFKMERLDYSDAALFTTLLPQNRVDTSRYGSLALVFTPTNKTRISATLYIDELKSSVTNYSYRAKGMMLNARLNF